MENHPSTVEAGAKLNSHIVPWKSLKERSAAAFTLAGVFLIASTLLPVALQPVTDWAWVSGIVLVGMAVLAVPTGLFGLYSSVSERAPHLATLGVLSATVAGAAALGLIAMGVAALVGEGTLGMNLGKPVGIFVGVSLIMAGGFSFGFLSLGAAGWRTGDLSRITSYILLIGGVALLIPIIGEVLRRGFGVETGIPSWSFLPALGLIALDTLALGFHLQGSS
jgi:hypothetical protein